MTAAEALQSLFRDNFVAYYHSQVAHVNITGRNFYSDHKLLGKIYESLQEEIDVIAEILRSIQEQMPTSLHSVIVDSVIEDLPVEGDADELLEHVQVMLEQLVESHQILAEAASEEDLEEIENYAQERILALEKQIWMLRSTLE